MDSGHPVKIFKQWQLVATLLSHGSPIPGRQWILGYPWMAAMSYEQPRCKIRYIKDRFDVKGEHR